MTTLFGDSENFENNIFQEFTRLSSEQRPSCRIEPYICRRYQLLKGPTSGGPAAPSNAGYSVNIHKICVAAFRSRIPIEHRIDSLK